jgi:hypothetical protein
VYEASWRDDRKQFSQLPSLLVRFRLARQCSERIPFHYRSDNVVLAAARHAACPYRGSHHTDPRRCYPRLENAFIRDGTGAGDWSDQDVESCGGPRPRRRRREQGVYPHPQRLDAGTRKKLILRMRVAQGFDRTADLPAKTEHQYKTGQIVNLFLGSPESAPAANATSSHFRIKQVPS